MIPFAYIAPITHTKAAIDASGMNMVLAHIAESNDRYSDLFKASDKYTLLDNGAFERGVPMSPEDMIRIGCSVGANTLVLPDYPYEPWEKGWEDLDRHIELYKNHGFKTMFIPQSSKDDMVGYYASLEKALEHPLIDQIGLSILAVPNAGLTRDVILERYENWSAAKKRFHILGMLDSVDEITDLLPYEELITGWDSSAPVWYGLNNKSVVGRTKKYKKKVDFYHFKEWNTIIDDNIEYVEDLLNG